MEEDVERFRTSIDSTPFFGEKDFPLWESGDNIYLTSSSGDQYVDLTSSYGVMSLGYNHPGLKAATCAQLEKLIHAWVPARVQIEFFKTLSEFLPDVLQNFIFACSGSKAVEQAILLALTKTEKKKIVYFKGGYHGSTISLFPISMPHNRFGDLSALQTEQVDMPEYDQLSTPAYVNFYLEKVQEKIQGCAALLLEPFFGEEVIIYPDRFLERLAALCEESGCLLIVDEIKTGAARTGKFLAYQYSDITPDIMCIGKGIASGLPLSLTVYHKEIESESSLKNVSQTTTTFAGSVLACARAVAVLNIIKGTDLCKKVRDTGAYFVEKLKPLTRFDFIKDVRGKGLLIGVEVTQNEDSRKIINCFGRELYKKKLFIEPPELHSTVFPVIPPLIITKEQIDVISRVFFDAASQTEEKIHESRVN